MKEKDNQKDFIDHVKERCIEATSMTEEKAHEFAMFCWKLGFTDSDTNQFLIDENYKLYTRTKLLEMELKEQEKTIDDLTEKGKTLKMGVELYESALEKACEKLSDDYASRTGVTVSIKNNWKQHFINEVVKSGPKAAPGGEE